MGLRRRVAQVLIVVPLVAIVLAALSTIVFGLLLPRPEVVPVLATPQATPLLEGVSQAVVGSECLSCHSVLADIPILAPDVRFSHEEHNKPGLHCDTCHDVARHKLIGGRGHELCLACHRPMIEAPDQCHRCHEVPAALRPPNHGADFVPRHAALVDASCAQCHDKETFCDRCHTLPMPHPAGFRASHGRLAAEHRGDCSRCHEASWCEACHRKTPPQAAYHTVAQHGAAAQELASNCALCHKQSECDACHGLRMPHPSAWASAHAEQYRRSREVCAKCHADLGPCLRCHQKVRPETHDEGWPKAHGKQADQSCAICHTAKQCTECHGGLEMPHPERFAVAHKAAVEQNPNSCAICHTRDYCLQCHKALKPKTHVEGYLAGHIKTAQGQRAQCLLCHDLMADPCKVCHEKLRRPQQ